MLYVKAGIQDTVGTMRETSVEVYVRHLVWNLECTNIREVSTTVATEEVVFAVTANMMKFSFPKDICPKQ